MTCLFLPTKKNTDSGVLFAVGRQEPPVMDI